MRNCALHRQAQIVTLERQWEGTQAGSAAFVSGEVWIKQGGLCWWEQLQPLQGILYEDDPSLPTSVFQVWQED